MSGYTHDGLRHAASMSRDLHAMRYMFAVGPPRSLITPWNPGVSRIRSISARIDASLRLWITRPSCSVIEQKLQPPKQPRRIVTENLIISYAGILAAWWRGCGTRANGSSYSASISGVVSGSGGGWIQTSAAPWRWTSARALPGLDSRWRMREAWA